DRGLRAGGGGARVGTARGRGTQRRGPRRRYPFDCRRRRPHRDRRRRRQGGGDRRGGEKHHRCHRCQAALDRSRGGLPRPRGPAGALAWSAGREACVRTAKGSERTLEVPSTVGGLAFAPKGLRLAIAHYNGLTLWFANAQSEPERLQWKGSHLEVVVSPDGRF